MTSMIPQDLRRAIERQTGAVIASELLRGGGGASRQGAEVFLRYADGSDVHCYLAWDSRAADAARRPFFDRETAILSALSGPLSDSGVRVARLLAAVPSHLALLSRFVGGDDRFVRAADPSILARDFMAQLAALHRIDTRHPALAALGDPTVPPSAAFRARVAQLKAGNLAAVPDPILQLALAWLADNVPDDAGPPVVLHGDAGPGNLLHDGDRVTALVDWEMAHLGDPMEDLAQITALRRAGHRVVGLDLAVPTDPARYLRCDCTNFGEVMGVLSGVDMTGAVPDAVVHLAGIPMPGLASDHQTFEVNTRSTYNIMSACARLGIGKLVWASSETILGLPFSTPPAFAPLDETHPDRPEWSYALSKQLGEQMAEAFARWRPDVAIFSLRFSNVFAPADYAMLRQIQAKPAARRMNLWSYVDVEDAAEACRLAVDSALTGHHRMIVAAADTLMDIPSAALMADYFPDVPLRPVEGNQSLLSSEQARALIGYQPRFSWRDRIDARGV